MCGTAGLFTGCDLGPCPLDLLRNSGSRAVLEDGRGEETHEYRSAFRTWFDRASVRSAPPPSLSTESERTVYFSPKHVPVARHQLVSGLETDSFRWLLTQHLYRYLHFTAVLEQVVVNQAVVAIGNGSWGPELPRQMRLDAHKIYCDEAYHSLVATELLEGVRRQTRIPPIQPAVPYFVKRLEHIVEGDKHLAPTLIRMLFVIVSETLISATLTEIPDDPEVSLAVRTALREHLSDEGRHHLFFASFLRYLWGALDPSERKHAGRIVPELIRCFLEPDVPAVEHELVSVGLSVDQAKEVVSDVFSDSIVNSHLGVTARKTVSYFAGLGVMEDPETLWAFRRIGLLEPERAGAE